MDAALVVERRHRFGPHDLATRGADLGKRYSRNACTVPTSSAPISRE